MQKLHRFYALDGLRGICALSVVIFHMHVAGTFTELPFFRHAQLFVEFFFVLSGFVLTHTYGSRINLEFKNFLISRTFRLFPLHLFMLAIFIVLELAKLAAYKKGIQFNDIPFTGVNSVLQILPNLLLIQSWTHATEFLSFNYPAWSISVEYYMYVIFGLIILYIFSYRKIVWLFISLVAFTLIYAKSTIFTGPSLSGLSCFFAGALTYLLFDSFREKISLLFWQVTLLEIFLTLLVIAAITLDFNHKEIICSFLFCVVVIVFALDQGIISAVLKRNFFESLGKLSYSIYLTHAAIVFVVISSFIAAQKLLGTPFSSMIGGVRMIDTGSDVLNNVVVLLTLGVVILFSMLTYRMIEMKGQQYGKKLIVRQKSKPPAVKPTAP